MSDAKPTVYQFSLDEFLQNHVQSDGIDSFLRILEKIRQRATVREAWNTQEALDLLRQDKAPRAIYITDPAIVDPENRELSKQVVEYARNGGTVILGLSFASNVHFYKFGEYMEEEWGLPWEVHSYERRDCAINVAASGPPDCQWLYGLQAMYEMKCLYIDGVAPNACWYTIAPIPYDTYEFGSEEEWRAAAAAREPETQTPVAFEPVGRGHLGFTGDVNQDETTDPVVLSMMGLNWPVRWCVCGGREFNDHIKKNTSEQSS